MPNNSNTVSILSKKASRVSNRDVPCCHRLPFCTVYLYCVSVLRVTYVQYSQLRMQLTILHRLLHHLPDRDAHLLPGMHLHELSPLRHLLHELAQEAPPYAVLHRVQYLSQN